MLHYKLKMNVDLKHMKFKHPCNTLVVGMTGSGKTQLIRRLLKHFEILFHNLDKKEINVLWAYGQWHSLIDIRLKDNINLIYFEGIPNEDQIIKTKPDIIVIDDLLNEMSNNKDFENLFIKKSHHLNISVIFSIQNLFYNAKNMRTISLNCHYIILMKNPRDKTQVMHLAKQIYPSDTKFITEAYNKATEAAYGYIKIDLTPDTPENLRIQSRITPEENLNIFSPIVYFPKNVSKY
jgi:hypothetical protein